MMGATKQTLVTKFAGSQCSIWSKRVLLAAILCTVFAMFTLPAVFYYITAYTDALKTSSQANQINTTTNNNTSAPLMIAGSTLNCTFTWGTKMSSKQSCNHYMGTICKNLLTDWHQCAISNGEIYVESNEENHVTLDQEIYKLQRLLVSYGPVKLDYLPKCQAVAVPFLCKYYFPLKDCSTRRIYTVSKEECRFISTTVCSSAWNLANSLGEYSHLLPKCDACITLPPLAEETVSNYSMFSLPKQNNIVDNITCRDDFYLFNNDTCIPRCDRFEEHPHAAIQTALIAEIIAVIIALSISCLALVLSIYNWKNMFRFPSVFLVFYILDVILTASLIIIPSVDRFGLLCSSKNLLDSIRNPSLYCLISGAVFHYTIVNMFIWWFFHLSIFFYKIMFPFHSIQMEKMGYQKYLAIILTTLGFVIPLPAVIVALSSEKHRYRIIRFPPHVCTTDEQMWFYSTTLVFNILIGTGTFLLIIIFLEIHKHQSSNTSRKKGRLNTAEKKIIIVFLTFIVFGVYLMVHFGVVTGNADKVNEGFAEYFACEASGHIPGQCDRSKFERYLFPYMSAVAYILLGLLPFTILNFVVNWDRLWKTLKRQFNKKSILKSNNQISTSSTKLKKQFTHGHFSIRSVNRSDMSGVPQQSPETPA